MDAISVAKRIHGSYSNRLPKENLTAKDILEDVETHSDIPDYCYGFMKNIRGSAAYWNTAKCDIFTMISQFGLANLVF